METVRAFSPPRRVRAVLLSLEYHVGKMGRREVRPQPDQPSSALAAFTV
jgi:hypothetical protein